MPQKTIRKSKRIGMLRFLFKKHAGHCTRCNSEVGLVSRLLKQDWKLSEQEGIVTSPDGKTVRVATIEHIVPRANGGTDEIENLTLYCSICNRETSALALWNRVMEGVELVVPEPPDVDETFWLTPLEQK